MSTSFRSSVRVMMMMMIKSTFGFSSLSLSQYLFVHLLLQTIRLIFSRAIGCLV